MPDLLFIEFAFAPFVQLLLVSVLVFELWLHLFHLCFFPDCLDPDGHSHPFTIRSQS